MSEPDRDNTPTWDHAYANAHFTLSEMPHAYGDNVHILGDPFSMGLLTRLCSAETTQPAFNSLIERLYTKLFVAVANHAFPRRLIVQDTRMKTVTERGVVGAEVVDPDMKLVTVDIARAGILPSHVCYSLANELLNPQQVRQDHLIVSRETDEGEHVCGAHIGGAKIGGTIDDAYVLFPDPMGATGRSLDEAISYYRKRHGTAPRRLIAMHLIITPDYLRHMKEAHPDLEVFAIRMDRGTSAADVLQTALGERWEEESGLSSNDYIVPGGGGFGELMNNSWV